VAKDRDVKGLYNLLAEDAVFHSPVVHTPQVGKSITGKYLSAAFEVFFNDSFTYVREVHGEGNAILEFEVEIQGVKVNGVDMISWNEAGLITEFKVMVRPLKAVSMIHQNMGAMLQAHS
jgi:ketosteroid isomerase-like protein